MVKQFRREDEAAGRLNAVSDNQARLWSFAI